MKIYNIPTERYFQIIKTKEDYNKFIGTGMAWELEPDCPSTWTEHLELIKSLKTME